LGNEGLSQSQRDHKRKANRKISFSCLNRIRIRKKGRPGSIQWRLRAVLQG